MLRNTKLCGENKAAINRNSVKRCPEKVARIKIS